jgi:hypothetical protein
MKIAFNEQECLQADPFAGDFGAPGDRTLRKQMVTARKAHEGCNTCDGVILPGERSRVQIEFFDGQLQQYRWCETCCRAMAMSFTDNGRMWESRERLRRLRREQ